MHVTLAITDDSVSSVEPNPVTNANPGYDVTGLPAAWIKPALSVACGVLGLLTNGFVLLVITRHKPLRQKVSNLLIIHQTVIDLLASAFALLTYGMLWAAPRLTGPGGDVICQLILSESLLWIGFHASTYNLVFLTIERYLMVAYPILHRKHVTKLRAQVTMVFSWLLTLPYNLPMSIMTCFVADGFCFIYAFSPSRGFLFAFGLYNTISGYALPMIILIYCYGSMIYTLIKRKRKVGPKRQIAAKPIIATATATISATNDQPIATITTTPATPGTNDLPNATITSTTGTSATNDLPNYATITSTTGTSATNDLPNYATITSTTGTSDTNDLPTTTTTATSAINLPATTNTTTGTSATKDLPIATITTATGTSATNDLPTTTTNTTTGTSATKDIAIARTTIVNQEPAVTTLPTRQTVKTSLSRAQVNVTKMMVIVTVAFIICWTPSNIYYTLFTFGFNLSFFDNLGITVSTLSSVSLFINPFIYIAKYDTFQVGMRKVLGMKGVSQVDTGETSITGM